MTDTTETKYAEWDDEGENLIPTAYDDEGENIEPTNREDALMMAERRIEKALNTHFLAVEKKIAKWDGSSKITYLIKNTNELIAKSLAEIYKQQGWTVTVSSKNYKSGSYGTTKKGFQITLA